jgi:hypothetical protein
MSTDDETQQQPAPEDGCAPPPEQCDPKVIDEVSCRAAGVAKQAEYDKTYTDALETAKTTYDEVRKKYRASRQAAALPAKELRHQIKHLIDRIRCLVEQRRVWVCLDDAFCEVLDQIACCGPEPGCCAQERSFDVEDAEDRSIRKLERIIKKYQRWTDRAKECFDSLAAEPDALTKRLEEVKAAVADVEAKLAADPATTDLKSVYVQAKIAQWKLEGLYGGFTGPQDFVDCLCLALTTWTAGCRAVSELTRVLAFKECCEEQAEKRCESLRTDTLDAVLAVYDRLCGDDPCPPDDDDGCDDEDEHHGHHHGHHHHHGHGSKRHGCGCHGHDDDDDGDGDGDGDDDDDDDDQDDDEDSDDGDEGDGDDGGEPDEPAEPTGQSTARRPRKRGA